jgi:MFS family permease
VGGLPFLLPLLYQLGLGFPAWQSGLLMMPSAAAAMGMKVISARLLRHFGYRQVLVVNTVLIGVTIALYAFVKPGTPWWAIVPISLCQGFFNSLQFSSMNSLGYADVEGRDSSMASTIASSMQQLSSSFGLVPRRSAANRPRGPGQRPASRLPHAGHADHYFLSRVLAFAAGRR